MSGNPRYLLDTNAVVALLCGRKELVGLVADAEWLGISVITQIEFLAFPDIDSEDINLFNEFLKRVNVTDICHDNLALIEQAIELRKKYSIKLPDALIAATALLHQAALATGDQRLLNLFGKIPEFAVLAISTGAGNQGTGGAWDGGEGEDE